jgi:hypothetical protein
MTQTDPKDPAAEAAALIPKTHNARQFLASFLELHFKDKTFARYIERDLAGDFALQLARSIVQATAAQPAYGWIDVDQALPETPANGIEASEDVIGARLDENGQVVRWDRVCLCADRKQWARDGILLKNWTPTHWSPLPSLFKE